MILRTRLSGGVANPTIRCCLTLVSGLKITGLHYRVTQNMPPVMPLMAERLRGVGQSGVGFSVNHPPSALFTSVSVVPTMQLAISLYFFLLEPY